MHPSSNYSPTTTRLPTHILASLGIKGTHAEMFWPTHFLFSNKVLASLGNYPRVPWSGSKWHSRILGYKRAPYWKSWTNQLHDFCFIIKCLVPQEMTLGLAVIYILGVVGLFAPFLGLLAPFFGFQVFSPPFRVRGLIARFLGLGWFSGCASPVSFRVCIFHNKNALLLYFHETNFRPITLGAYKHETDFDEKKANTMAAIDKGRAQVQVSTQGPCPFWFSSEYFDLQTERTIK